MPLGALGALRPAVVTGRAEGLQVVLVPEQRLIAAVRLLVVNDQLRCVRRHQPAAGPLASEHVADQDDHAHRPPPRRLVQLTPWGVQGAVLLARSLDRGQSTKARLEAGQPIGQRLELTHFAAPTRKHEVAGREPRKGGADTTGNSCAPE